MRSAVPGMSSTSSAWNHDTVSGSFKFFFATFAATLGFFRSSLINGTEDFLLGIYRNTCLKNLELSSCERAKEAWTIKSPSHCILQVNPKKYNSGNIDLCVLMYVMQVCVIWKRVGRFYLIITIWFVISFTHPGFACWVMRSTDRISTSRVFTRWPMNGRLSKFLWKPACVSFTSTPASVQWTRWIFNKWKLRSMKPPFLWRLFHRCSVGVE